MLLVKKAGDRNRKYKIAPLRSPAVRLADAIEKAAELERRTVEKMEEMVGAGNQAAV